MVAKANRKTETLNNAVDIFPSVAEKEENTIIIGADRCNEATSQFSKITKAVIVQTSIVSINTSITPRNPCSQAELVFEVACAIGEVPQPASLEKSPLIVPYRNAFENKKPSALASVK